MILYSSSLPGPWQSQPRLALFTQPHRSNISYMQSAAKYNFMHAKNISIFN